MKRDLFIFLLLMGMFIDVSIVSAQKMPRDSIFFTGAVMDQKELTPLPNTHFRINSDRVGSTNQYGRFSFWVNSGDTVKYSYVGYRPVKVIISDSLRQERYLFGVFMAKDTVALQEVLILPRFGDFKEAFINAKVNTPEYVHAKNNVNSATFEALTTTPEKMDAKANVDMQMHNFQVKMENKVMVPPDMLVGVSLSRTVPAVKQMKRRRKMKVPDLIITDKEIDILKSMYRFDIEK